MPAATATQSAEAGGYDGNDLAANRRRLAAETAVQLSCQLLSQMQGGKVAAAEIRLWLLLESCFWNQTHAPLARVAQQIDVPFHRLYRNGQEFLQLGQGARSRLCYEALTDRTPMFAC